MQILHMLEFRDPMLLLLVLIGTIGILSNFPTVRATSSFHHF